MEEESEEQKTRTGSQQVPSETAAQQTESECSQPPVSSQTSVTCFASQSSIATTSCAPSISDLTTTHWSPTLSMLDSSANSTSEQSLLVSPADCTMAHCPLATANDTSTPSNVVSTSCTTEAPPLATEHGITLQSTFTSMNCTPEQSPFATAGNSTLCQSSLASADVTTTQSGLAVMSCTSEVPPLATAKPVLSTAVSTNSTSGPSPIATADGVANDTPIHSTLTLMSCTSEVSPLAALNPVQSTVAPMTCPPEVSPLAPASSSVFQPQTEFIVLGQTGQALQCERMVIVTGQSEGREVFVIPSNQLSGSQLLLPRSQLVDIINPAGSGVEKESLHTITVTAVSDDISSISSLPAVAAPIRASAHNTSADIGQDVSVSSLKPLPANAPSWAQRLRNAEKIGDSYRGYCSTEAELETILLLHKQQTGCVFGTRQSPSLAKPATRLMWKSQYVPYDGIPFVNAGSRAIVMECQYGPRRKGLQPKKNQQLQSDYKTTCPARIYIKKVRKFPEHRVSTEPTADRKTVRLEQEKAFCSLRTKLLDIGGALRYYMQLPTEKAHLYHDTDAPIPPPPPDLLPPAQEQQQQEEEKEVEGEMEDGGEEGGMEDGSSIPSRLHPRVAEKIGELVAQGHHQVYSVRKQLRHFVEREMFKSEGVPERHNQCYFPTVNDIKNHIHEAQKALGLTEWGGVCGDALTETVTLTLTPATTEVTGVLEGSETLSPEAVQLFSSLTSLQPKIFAQLQGIQLQPVTTLFSVDESLSQPSTPDLSTTCTPATTQPLTHANTTSAGALDLPNPLPPPSPHPSPPLSPTHPLLFFSHTGQLELPHAPPSLNPPPSLSIQPSPSLLPSTHPSPSPHPSPSLSPPQSLVVSPTSFLQTSSPLGETLGLAGPQTVLGVGQMVSVSALGDGGTHQIILEDGQTIPVQIVDTETIALTGTYVLQVEVKDKEEVKKEEEGEREQGEEEEMEEEEEEDKAIHSVG